MTDFEVIAQAIMGIGERSSRNDKVYLLEQYSVVTGFKEVLQFIYNPYIRTGIAAAKLKKNVAKLTTDFTWQDFINHFTTHQTGSDFDVAVAKRFISCQPPGAAQKLATAMATKTLKIGITETTLNKVYGEDFIPKIGIMRGEHYKDFKDKVKGPFIVTEKLDGARRILVKEKGNVTLYTRSGHVDEGLVDIEHDAQFLPDNIVFDGELLAIGQFPNAVALRQATNAIANAKGKRTGVTFNVFDTIALEDFKKGTSSHDAFNRKALVAALFHDTESLEKLGIKNYKIYEEIFGMQYKLTHIKPVPILGLANTEAEVFQFAEPIWARQFEGVMLNTVNGLYEIASSPRRQLLKVKATEEFTLECIGMFEGEGKYKGMMGGIYLRYKDGKVGCGSGFNDTQRMYLWHNQHRIVGKMVEIDSFGESTNQNGGVSLNCPIFKRIVGAPE